MANVRVKDCGTKLKDAVVLGKEVQSRSEGLLGGMMSASRRGIVVSGPRQEEIKIGRVTSGKGKWQNVECVRLFGTGACCPMMQWHEMEFCPYGE